MNTETKSRRCLLKINKKLEEILDACRMNVQSSIDMNLKQEFHQIIHSGHDFAAEVNAIEISTQLVYSREDLDIPYEYLNRSKLIDYINLNGIRFGKETPNAVFDFVLLMPYIVPSLSHGSGNRAAKGVSYSNIRLAYGYENCIDENFDLEKNQIRKYSFFLEINLSPFNDIQGRNLSLCLKEIKHIRFISLEDEHKQLSPHYDDFLDRLVEPIPIQEFLDYFREYKGICF